MRNTFSLKFYLKKDRNIAQKTYPIIARITLSGQVSVISTNLRCDERSWSQSMQMIKGKSKNAEEVNQQLYNIRSAINQIYNQNIFQEEILTANIIKEIYTGMRSRKHHLIANFEIHNESVRKQVGVCRSIKTFQKYERTKKHLEGYLNKEYQAEDILLHRVDYRFIHGFEIYLRTTAGCGHNTTMKFLQFFKRIIILALNNRYIRENPFQAYKITLKKVKRSFLTKSELIRLMKKEFKIKRLELIRDLFVFSTFTGLSYIDLKTFNKSHITDINGELWIWLDRTKTDETSRVKLFKIPAALIRKYEDPERETIFPVPSNQKVNAYLKGIADVCEIDKNLTFHVARHNQNSFSLNVCQLSSIS